MSVTHLLGYIEHPEIFWAEKRTKQEWLFSSIFALLCFQGLSWEIWKVCLNYSNWHFIARHPWIRSPDSLNFERPYSKGWNSFEAHFDLCQNNQVCPFSWNLSYYLWREKEWVERPPPGIPREFPRYPHISPRYGSSKYPTEIPNSNPMTSHWSPTDFPWTPITSHGLANKARCLKLIESFLSGSFDFPPWLSPWYRESKQIKDMIIWLHGNVFNSRLTRIDKFHWVLKFYTRVPRKGNWRDSTVNFPIKRYC